MEINSSSDLKKLKGITYGALNIRSLFKHIEEVQILLRRSELDILLLEETFINYSVDNSIIGIDGYNLFRMDRDGGTGRSGGGSLCVYTKDKYKISHIVDWNLCTPDIEVMWVCLELKDTRKTNIANIYCPPSGSIKNFLELIELQVLNIYIT